MLIQGLIDFMTMERKLQKNEYASVESFVADAQLIFDNCRLYNPPESIYTKNANRLEKQLLGIINERQTKKES